MDILLANSYPSAGGRGPLKHIHLTRGAERGHLGWGDRTRNYHKEFVHFQGQNCMFCCMLRRGMHALRNIRVRPGVFRCFVRLFRSHSRQPLITPHGRGSRQWGYGKA